MKIFFPAAVVIILAFVCPTAFSQRKPVRVALPEPAQKRQPGYELDLHIAADGKYLVTVTSPAGEGTLAYPDLSSLIADLPAGANKYKAPNNVFPKVIISADPQLSIVELWTAIVPFPRGADIHISIPNGMVNGDLIQLGVPWDPPDPLMNINVKPNPLFLVVKVEDDGKLTLNNEPEGNLSNTKTLSDHLQTIFREREANGVFREGSNEVEKAVIIVMPVSSRKFSDLVAVTRAIWLPGGDRISLTMGDLLPNVEDERKTLLDLPVAPPKKKPSPRH